MNSEGELNYNYMYLYRYEINYHSNDVKVNLNLYRVIKETSKGYWIDLNDNFFTLEKFKKWVSKEGFNRFAYPTKHEAMVNFKKRTEKRIKLLKNSLYACEQGLNNTKNMNIIEDNIISIHLHMKNKEKLLKINCGLEQLVGSLGS